MMSEEKKGYEAFDVIIEIPMHGGPVKYEMDKKLNTLRVDRVLATSMVYPTNYGYIPDTLSEDGDPVDVLVVAPAPFVHGAIVRCRALGMLKMTDEAGKDAKLLAVPVTKISKIYQNVQNYKDLPSELLRSIVHFFEHYKDLEEGKWVKIEDFEGIDAAYQEIANSIERFQSTEEHS
jgi:inorganic pyrophosphatase